MVCGASENLALEFHVEYFQRFLHYMRVISKFLRHAATLTSRGLDPDRLVMVGLQTICRTDAAKLIGYTFHAVWATVIVGLFVNCRLLLRDQTTLVS